MKARHVLLILFAIIVFFGIVLLAVSLLVGSKISFGNKIAVVPLKGEIVADKIDVSAELSAMEIVEKISEAEENASIRAILLEINSPGGDIVATRQIVEKVRNAKKPVVAWISEYGASGAYYVAAASDHIVADPDSITGSIGAIAIFPNIEGLLEKLGVKVKVLKKGEHKAIGSPFEEISAEDEAILQKLLDDAFKRFKKDIIELRFEKLKREDFEIIADGRVLSGEQAKTIGLVDSFGTKETALEKAAELAGIEDFETADFSKPELSFLELFSKIGYNFGTGFRKGFFLQGINGVRIRN